MSPAGDAVRALAAEALADGDGLPEWDTADGLPPSGSHAAPAGLFDDLKLEADGMPSADLLRGALRAVVDPEIGYNIVDLGLVYAVTKPAPGCVRVEMTLTSVGCPLAEVIDGRVRVVLSALPGVDAVDVHITFSPPWNTGMIAGWVRDELAAMGMRL